VPELQGIKAQEPELARTQ